ncbi:Uncharacterised protein [Halioglobus japonicus]|nr:Uncharacterised protein [Halioglobus japonicus]
MKIIHVITALVTILFSAHFAQASEKTIIHIDVDGSAEFDVLYHRATSNATGAVIAGLIGAGIQSGIESNQDSAKVDVMEPMIDKASWRTYFLDTLNTRLESKNYEAEWIGETIEPTEGLLLTIYPDNYGFKIVDTKTLLMSAFVQFEATLVNLQDETSRSEKKDFYVTSKDRRTYDALLSDKVLMNADLQSALRKAAKRIANKIIYNKEV